VASAELAEVIKFLHSSVSNALDGVNIPVTGGMVY